MPTRRTIRDNARQAVNLKAATCCEKACWSAQRQALVAESSGALGKSAAWYSNFGRVAEVMTDM